MTDLAITEPDEPVDRHAWRSAALCAHTLGISTDDWFPPEPDFVPDYLAALCHACPVRSACLDWALTNREHGIWAGTTEDDRNRIRRRIRDRRRRDSA